MAPVPRYWYVEPADGGLPLQLDPHLIRTEVPSPAIGDDTTVYDDQTGEVYGQAVLMAALPWPRFRTLGTGEEVVLPHGMAVTLEGCGDSLTPVLAGEWLCPHCARQRKSAGFHYRVEDGEVVRLTVHCDLHF